MQGRGRFENRQQELASISRSLKALAKELSVPILVLSQLSRAPGSALRSPAAALGPARVGRPRAGRRRRDVHLPARTSTRRPKPRTAERRRDHHRQAAQRPDRHGQAGVPQPVHALREHRAGQSATTDRAARRSPASISTRSRGNFRATRRLRSRAARRRPVDAGARRSSAWSRPTPTDTARRGRPGARSRRRVDARLRRHRRGRVAARGRRHRADPGLRRPGHRRCRRHLRPPADADDVDAVGRTLAAAAPRRARPAVVPPEDRHRHEPPRVPPR